jgi:hypothetical protein
LAAEFDEARDDGHRSGLSATTKPYEAPAEVRVSDKDWLNLRRAVGRIREYTGLSTGAAQALLHKACRSSEVRSRGLDLSGFGSRGKKALLPLLSENDWDGNSINLDNGHLEGPGGMFGIMNVTVSAEDLDWWLENRWHPDAAPGHRLGRRAVEPAHKTSELLIAHTDDARAALMPTGAPGRPTTGMYLIRVEFERRLGGNACKPTLREEATELRQWFCSNYPTAPPPTIKTIENKLRSDYRQHVAGQRLT